MGETTEGDFRMIHPIGVIRRGEQSFVRQRLKEYDLVPVEAFEMCIRDSLMTPREKAIRTPRTAILRRKNNPEGQTEK